ncbi:MAG: histidine kinase [Clostridium butyricum]|nr:histidine kinase [Clostridium butyricum]
MKNTCNLKVRQYTIEDLEELLDRIPYEIWIKDQEGKYKYVNKNCAEKLGVNKEDIIGKNDFEFRPYNIAKNYIDDDKKVLNSKNGILSEDKIMFENEKWYEIYKTVFDNSNNKDMLIGGFGKEIDIYKSFQNGIISNFLAAITDDEFDDGCLELNIINNLKELLSAKAIAVYLYDSDEDKMIYEMQTGKYNDYFSDTYFLNNEEKIIFQDSEYKPLRIGNKYKKYAYPVKFKNYLHGAIVICYDKMPKYIQEDIIKYTCIIICFMLEKRRLTNLLEKEVSERKSIEKILQMVINAGLDAYSLLRLNGYNAEWIEMSKRCAEILGWQYKDVNKVNLLKLVHEEDCEKFKNMIEKNVKECKNFVCRFLCANNEYKYLDLNWSNLKDDLFIVTARDITNETNLKKDKADLEEAVELESLKTEFFANLSHEFKTPLNIILSTVQVLNYLMNKNKKIESNKLKEYISGIKQNAYRLLKLADNMIDITKIDGGYYELHIDNYNIVEIVENIILSVADYMKRNMRNIIFDTTEEEIITACDQEQIERIILNLLSNSLKFTSTNGNIAVNISTSEDCRYVIIRVSNDGVPIDRESAEKIFGRFTQIDNLMTRSNEGSGIGLALVKSLVEIHNGRIYVNTEVNKGTEFCIEIPIRKLRNSHHNNVMERNIISKVQKYKVEFSDIYSDN